MVNGGEQLASAFARLLTVAPARDDLRARWDYRLKGGTPKPIEEMKSAGTRVSFRIDYD